MVGKHADKIKTELDIGKYYFLHQFPKVSWFIHSDNFSMSGSQPWRQKITPTPALYSESIRLDHGSNRSFLLSFTRDLGDINIVSITWTYDHEIDPLNLTKVCFLLCSDHLYVRSVTVQGAST